MANAIARTLLSTFTIDAYARKIPNAPIVFESATSHDNFVEVHYAAKDAQFFLTTKPKATGGDFN
jgi:hypothetical protein